MSASPHHTWLWRPYTYAVDGRKVVAPPPVDEPAAAQIKLLLSAAMTPGCNPLVADHDIDAVWNCLIAAAHQHECLSNLKVSTLRQPKFLHSLVNWWHDRHPSEPNGLKASKQADPDPHGVESFVQLFVESTVEGEWAQATVQKENNTFASDVAERFDAQKQRENDVMNLICTPGYGRKPMHSKRHYNPLGDRDANDPNGLRKEPAELCRQISDRQNHGRKIARATVKLDEAPPTPHRSPPPGLEAFDVLLQKTMTPSRPDCKVHHDFTTIVSERSIIKSCRYCEEVKVLPLKSDLLGYGRLINLQPVFIMNPWKAAHQRSEDLLNSRAKPRPESNHLISPKLHRL